jgi:PPOX class probable F420-dependent enzyme
VRLSDEEAWEVLARAHTGILTTLRGDGTPISLPMWFVAMDERVYVATPEHTKKVARIKSNPRVSFLIESGDRWVDLLGVHLTGHADVVDDAGLAAQVRQAMDEKYGAFRPAGRRPPVDITVLEITPDERLLTWDNSRTRDV